MKIKSRWEPVYIGRYSSTLEITLKSGSVWSQTIHSDGSRFITRYPSEQYMENYLLGNNAGHRLREWIINY